MDNSFFDWRWDDEKLKSEYQLVIERSSEDQMYKEAKISGNDIVFTVNTKQATKEISFNLNKYLKDLFIKEYSILDPIDLEAFLEYHFKAFKGDKKEFLKHIKTILTGMKVLNQFDLNPKGRIKIGKRWVNEKLTAIEDTERKSKSRSGLGKPPHEDPDFNKIFEGKKYSAEQFLERLRTGHYINEKNEWIDKEHEWIKMRALIQCLRKHQHQMIIERARPAARLFRVLRQRIEIHEYTRPSDSIPDEHKRYIKDFEDLFKLEKAQLAHK